MSLLITGGRIIDPANQLDSITDLYLADGKIVAVGDQARSFDAEQTLDASGLVVCPGLVDLNVHIPEPGYEHKGTVTSETTAAAAGGITSLCCIPDTAPVIDTPSVANLIADLMRDRQHAKVHPIGAMTQGLKGKQLSEMHALKSTGCIGVTQGFHPIDNNRTLLRCLEYAVTHDITVFFNSLDLDLADNGCAHAGVNSMVLGLPGVPETAETVALSRNLLLVEQTGVKAHFGLLSCARSVDMIADAKARGLPVTADVAIHNLLYTDDVLKDFNSQYHVQPPLRSEQDRQALCEGVQSGVIDAIVSQHRPHERAAKMAPFGATETGISGLETLLPLTLQLVERGELDLNTAIARLTSGPAQAINLDAGSLNTGEAADLCLFDPEASWQVSEDSLLSNGKNTPVLGQKLKGQVRHTYLDGVRTR